MTPLEFVLVVLATVGAHRIWNKEALFSLVRAWLIDKPIVGWVLCPTCNLFWIGAGVWGLSEYGDACAQVAVVWLAMFGAAMGVLRWIDPGWMSVSCGACTGKL